METVSEKKLRYRQIVQTLLTQLTAGVSLEPEMEDHTLFDTQQDRYVVIANGWDGETRVNFIVAHIEIIDGQVWVQADNTDAVLARKLEQAGVAQHDIVLGFRKPTTYAALEAMAA
jgi:XisI protein